MINAAPHYLLISESQSFSNGENGGGRWRFVLEQLGGKEKLVVADSEPDVTGERLQLLTVIRGLEALDQPSIVTLLTPSRYVSHGIRRGLPHWRESNWCWERFGQMCPISDYDLWQRLDRALHLHRVDCRNWRVLNSEAAPQDVAQVTTRPPRQVAARSRSRFHWPQKLTHWVASVQQVVRMAPNFIL